MASTNGSACRAGGGSAGGESRGDMRPGWCTCEFGRRTPPPWYRNALNRRERRRLARALFRGEALGRPYVRPGWRRGIRSVGPGRRRRATSPARARRRLTNG